MKYNDYSCSSKKSLKKHTSQGHEEQDPMSTWTCKDCGHQCTSKNDMKDHINVKHNNNSKKSESDCYETPEVDEAELDEWITRAKATEN